MKTINLKKRIKRIRRIGRVYFKAVVRSFVQPLARVLSCRAAKWTLRILSYLTVWRILCPDVRLIECFSTLTAIWWTLLLWGTPKMFATNPLFSGLAERGKEREWGAVTALLSVVGLWVIVGASATVRFIAAALSFILWTFVALNLAQGVPQVHPTLFGTELAFTVPESTGAGIYSLLAAFSVIAAIKLGPHVIFDLHYTIVKCASRRATKQNAA